jgi:hypothetical protein
VYRVRIALRKYCGRFEDSDSALRCIAKCGETPEESVKKPKIRELVCPGPGHSLERIARSGFKFALSG